MLPLSCMISAALLLGSQQLPEEPPAPLPVESLERIFETPRPWLEREVRITFQLRSTPEHWNPYLTRFGTRDYVAAEVWGDGQFLWRSEDFGAPLGLIFAPRGSAAALVLEGSEPYARFTAHLHVRQVFGGHPWAEIVELELARRSVGEGTILHASRALQLMAGEEWQLARDDLLRAAAPLLPEHAQAELERLIADCNAGLVERAKNRETQRGSKRKATR